MLTVIALLKQPTPGHEAQGERSFWATLGPDYLLKLLAGLTRHLGAEYQVTLLTDQKRYAMGPRVRQVPLLTDAPGWWAKVEMFRPSVSQGTCLYLDLDNVIAGPLHPLAALTPDPLIMADDRLVPGLPNGSVMLFNADRLRFLWDEYVATPRAIEAEFSETRWPHASDQAFIADRVRRAGFTIPCFQDLLPPGYLLMSQELESGADWSGAHLVCGQSLPKPHQSTHPFFAAHWR